MQDADGQQPNGKAGERFKVACGCQPPRSFWIRAKQYTPGADLLRRLRPRLLQPKIVIFTVERLVVIAADARAELMSAAPTDQTPGGDRSRVWGRRAV